IVAMAIGVACAPPAVAVSPSVAPSITASPTPTASSASSVSTGFADAPGAAVWPAVALYTVTDDGIAHKVSQAATSDLGRVCDGRALGMLARDDGAALLVRCISSTNSEE